MSDTITLYEKCIHGRVNAHDDVIADVIGCPGGRERKLLDRNMVRALRGLLRKYGHEDGLERALREWLVEVSDVE